MMEEDAQPQIHRYESIVNLTGLSRRNRASGNYIEAEAYFTVN